MKESDFESHIAKTLGNGGWIRVSRKVPSESFIDLEELAVYLKTLQQENKVLQKFSLDELVRIVRANLEENWKKGVPSSTIYKKGVTLVGHDTKIHLIDPAKSENNRFTFQTQYQHDINNQDRKLDVMLWVNGLPLAAIEIKNQQTGQTARDGMEQLLHRVREKQCPNLFKHCVFTAALDTNNVFLSISPEPLTEKNFRPFDPSEGYKAPKKEFNTYHFYGEFLKPSNLTELIHQFLYEEEKSGEKNLIFPRFHQWECVKLVRDTIEESSKDRVLGEEFLLQHSAGSGKSKTIAWLCQFLKGGFFIPGTQESIFSKVLVITDRKDLDQQLQRDLLPILGEHAVRKAESKKHLGELLTATLPPVITSTVQKFQDFNKDLWPRDKRIAIIIDEAHRSQDGSYNENLRKSLQGKVLPDEDVVFVGDKIFDEVADKNTVLIALTATPTQSTLERFGKDGKTPHHLYSMRQAIEEGYIINVAKNIVTYDTLYQLHRTGANIPLLDTYPSPFLNRTLTWAAYESEDIIEEKAKVIAAIVRSKTMNAIGGKGRAMLTCISRKAASLYQKKLKELLEEYNVSPLVAYTDSGDEVEKFASLNREVGANAKDDEELKTLFREEDKYRILVVASKFQTGFDETLLHTLFLDKPVKGINAVQTLSRLNRVHLGKEDTLIVDFTNSYEEIAKAFNQFLGQSESIQSTAYSLDDLTTAFVSLCSVTKTKDQDWTPSTQDNEDLPIVIDNTCKRLSKKISDKKPLQGVLDILDFLLGKSILIDNTTWTTRKAVIKGVIGYLSSSTGKYSAAEIREAVAAIGLATRLVHLGNKGLEIKGKRDGVGGGGKPPPEVSMGEAINKLNQENLVKLQRYISEAKTRLTCFLEELDEGERVLLNGLFDVCQQTLVDFGDEENIDELVLRKHERTYEETLMGMYNYCEEPKAKIKEFLQLCQGQMRLASIEERFYLSRASVKDALEEGIRVSQEVGASLDDFDERMGKETKRD